MRVWLAKKYAERLDGVDLSHSRVGDTLDLPYGEARLLLAEEWAHPERRGRAKRTTQQRRVTDDDLRLSERRPRDWSHSG